MYNLSVAQYKIFQTICNMVVLYCTVDNSLANRLKMSALRVARHLKSLPLSRKLERF